MARIQQASFHAGTIDSELLSEAMLIEPQIYRDIVLERYAATTPLMAMAELFGSQFSETTFNQDMYTWGILGPPKMTAQIISTSGTAKVGNTWQIELSKDCWFQKGAVIKLENDWDAVLLVSDGVETSKGVLFNAQVKGQNPDYTLSSELIATGKFVSFDTTNFWEGSDRGHQIPFVTPSKLINAGSITRTDLDITGTALTTGILYENIKVADDGAKKKYRGFLPMGVTQDGKLHLDFHMMQTETGLMSNVANFDPTTGKIYNSVDGKKALSGDGFERQMEAGHTIEFHPNDRPAEVTSKLERFITHRAVTDTVDTMDQLVMGGSGLQRVLHHTFRDFMVKNNEQTFINVGADKKVKAGLKMDTFVTPKGEIKFVYNPYFDRTDKKVKTITYKGVALPVSSYRGYFMPIRQLTNAQGDAIPSIQVMSRVKAGINRSLVPGTIPGMSGLVQKLGANASKFKASYENYTKVATGRDGETFMFLSEKMLIVHNPTEFARLMPLY